MAKPEGVFREAALDRLSTPERLDELIQVTDARSWLALGAVICLIVGLGIWGVFGTVTTRVDGRGMLLGGDLYDVVPLAEGRIVELAVDIGDTVEAGSLIARVDQPDLQRQVVDARARLTELREEAARIQSFDSRSVLLGRVKELERQIEVERGLVDKGLITEEQARATELSRDNAVREIEVERQQQSRFAERIADGERALAAAVAELEVRSRIESPRAGRVVARLADVGEPIVPGVPIVKLDLTSAEQQTLRAILFVSTGDGKRIKEGMAVRISPDSVKPEEHGYMIGRVAHVDAFPATTQSMMQVLRNDQLVRQMAEGGAPFKVLATLEVDAESFSGYRWTSAGGPAMRIGSGTPCTTRIAVQRQRPIELVIPAIRRMFKVY